MNILIFTAAFCIMAVVMTILLNGIVSRISSEYAGHYAFSTAEALNAHINKEIDIVTHLANSRSVLEWMKDEVNEEKMQIALSEMSGLIGELYSFNMYIAFVDTLNQYRVGRDYETGGALLIDVARLDVDEPDDVWFFRTLNSDRDYVLDVGLDHIMQRKWVWLDYKVAVDGIPLGVISTGLEFSHMVGELFSQYERGNMRGLLIDGLGTIHMDSSLMRDRDFLHNDFAETILEEFTNPVVLAAVESYLGSIENYPEETGLPTVIRVTSGPYNNLAMTQIKSTNWSLVILSGSTSFFAISNFFPILATVLVLLIIVALVTSAANFRLIFLPLGKLGKSLTCLRESVDGHISGTERDDELGELSRTIKDLFTKANVDALTGIYNRRFMENNLELIMGMLSRSNGFLSVLMLDIDFFKKFNDTYGHEQGDICLRSVAQAMAVGVTRASDFIARYGGEEFITILPNTDENGARVVAEKLLSSVSALGIPHSGNAAAPHVTVSIGVTTGMVLYENKWEDFVKRADDALYESKRHGRNKYTFLEMTQPQANSQ